MTENTKTILVVVGVIVGGVIVWRLIDMNNQAVVQNTSNQNTSSPGSSSSDILAGAVRGIFGGIADLVRSSNTDSSRQNTNQGGNSAGTAWPQNLLGQPYTYPWTNWGTPQPYTGRV